jgi:hypothetical protein
LTLDHIEGPLATVLICARRGMSFGGTSKKGTKEFNLAASAPEVA